MNEKESSIINESSRQNSRLDTSDMTSLTHLQQSHRKSKMLSTIPRVLATSSGKAVTLSTGIMSFYSLAATKSDGSVQAMEEYKGKVVYATNVASK